MISTKRRTAEICALSILVVVIGGWLWSRRSPPYPYPDGRSLTVTADCTGSLDGGCWIQLGSPTVTAREWTGAINPPTDVVGRPKGSLPPGWAGQHVTGTLHIIHSWGTPTAATFTSGGYTLIVWGGRPDRHHHAFTA